MKYEFSVPYTTIKHETLEVREKSCKDALIRAKKILQKKSEKLKNADILIKDEDIKLEGLLKQ